MMYTKNFPTGHSPRTRTLLKDLTKAHSGGGNAESARDFVSRCLGLDDFHRQSGSMASRVENRRSGWGRL
jgi:hypothetical protein